MREDYERQLKELEKKKDVERDDLKKTLEVKIRDLENLLRKERENMQGSAKEREEQLKREIEDWKKKLALKEKENEELLRQIKALQSEKIDL